MLVELDDALGRCAVRRSTSRAKTTAAAGRAADDRGVGALERHHLQVVVQGRGEDDVGAAVVAGDHAEDDRPAEVHHRPADLRAVLELQRAHRLGRAVEARQVGEHHRRAVAGGGVDGARHLLATSSGKSVPDGPVVGPVRGHVAEARQRLRSMPTRHTGQPPRCASQTTAISASCCAAQRSSGCVVLVGTARSTRADVEGLLAVAVGVVREDVADRAKSVAEGAWGELAADVAVAGRRCAARRGKRSPGAT